MSVLEIIRIFCFWCTCVFTNFIGFCMTNYVTNVTRYILLYCRIVGFSAKVRQNCQSVLT